MCAIELHTHTHTYTETIQSLFICCLSTFNVLGGKNRVFRNAIMMSNTIYETMNENQVNRSMDFPTPEISQISIWN